MNIGYIIFQNVVGNRLIYSIEIPAIKDWRGPVWPVRQFLFWFVLDVGQQCRVYEVKKGGKTIKIDICTFPTLVLKLYVLQELFPFKAGKRVQINAKINENNI